MSGFRRSIFIGYDPREHDAYAACEWSLRRLMGQLPPIQINALVLQDLRARGLYRRPTQQRPGVDRPVLFDVISDHAMATEFAISRFLIGQLAGQGYAVFMDCDMLVRANLHRLFDFCEKDNSKAVWCVKHRHEPACGLKMDGQIQSAYSRKNWSSVMVWNVDHEANKSLTLEMINALPGRDLHRFCWLDESEIGELPVEWNWLVGHSPAVESPKIVHFTDGIPSMRGFENSIYADEWRAARNASVNPA